MGGKKLIIERKSLGVCNQLHIDFSNFYYIDSSFVIPWFLLFSKPKGLFIQSYSNIINRFWIYSNM